MKRFLRFLLFVVVFGVVVSLSYKFFFEEYLVYMESTKSCISYNHYDFAPGYLSAYPEGMWKDEVMDHWIACKYQNLQYNVTLRSINKFRNLFPGSKHDEEMVQLKDSIWAAAYTNYEASVAEGNSNPKAVRFFKELLDYMDENNKSVIFVKLNGKSSLKDYKSYSQFIKSNLAITFTNPPLESNMIALTRHFNSGSLNSLTGILDKGVKNSFSKLFGNAFVEVETWREANPNDRYENKEDLPDEDDIVIEIDYQIRNAEESGYPIVWTYREANVILSYLLGIVVDYDFNLDIPNSDRSYSFKQMENPGESFTTTGGLRDAYPTMTRITFQHYANDISKQLGLQTAYNEHEIK